MEYVTVHDASYRAIFRVGVLGSKGTFGDDDLRSKVTTLLTRGGFGAPDLFASSLPSTLVFDTVLESSQDQAQRSSRGSTITKDSSPCAAALAPVKIVLLPQKSLFRRLHEDIVFCCHEALIFVHPAGDLYVRRALKFAGFVLTDEEKNVALDMSAITRTEAQAYAYQLSSAPDPWLAAGGKDRTTSKLEKQKKGQAYAAGSAKNPTDRKENQKAKGDATSAIELDEMTELRRKQGYNLFEIVGPKGPTLLRSLLQLPKHSNTEAAQTSLDHFLLNGPGQGDEKFPRSDASMIAVEVFDPRLSYPPRLKPVSRLSAQCAERAEEDMADVANSRLLSVGANGPKFSKGEIDSRRAKNLIPGSRLQPDTRDDVVPVVLIKQRLIEKLSVDAFTLIVPRGWGLAFFMSLIATHHSGAASGARVIGQHQLRHQKLELSALAGARSVDKAAHPDMLNYPYNWPGTSAFARMDKEAVLARIEVWAKRPKGKRTEYKWPSSSDWKRVQEQDHQQSQQQRALLSKDRTGVARPFPFGGPGAFEWVVHNSQALYGPSRDANSHPIEQTWLVSNTVRDSQAISLVEVSLAASSIASALVPLKLTAVRKGTITPQSSLMMAPVYADHVSWVTHLDSAHHPALVANRQSSVKMDKKHLKGLVERRLDIMQLGKSASASAPGAFDTQLAKRKHLVTSDVWSQYLETAPDPETLHDLSADWNHTIGLVLDGDYSLGNGRGFGIGAITLRAWKEVLSRQDKLDAQLERTCAGRAPRNQVTTTNLLLMREPGTDVLRAVTADFIPL